MTAPTVGGRPPRFAVPTLLVFLTHASSGTPLVTGLLTCGISMVLGFVTADAGMLAGWADPLNLVLTSCLYLAPIGAGVAAAHVGWIERSGTAALADTTLRGRRGALRLGLAAITAWQVLALLVFATLVLIRADLHGSRSLAMLLLPAQASALLVAAVCVGGALGRWWTARLAGPVTAGLCFVLLYVLALQTGAASRFSPIYSDVFYRVPLQPRVSLLLPMSALLLAAGLMGYAGLVRTRAALLVGGVVGAVLLCAGVLGLQGAGAERTEVRPAPSRDRCQTLDGVTLCAWPETQTRQLHETLRTYAAVRRATAGFIALPSTVREWGLPRSSGEVQLWLANPGEPFLPDAVLAAVLPVPRCTSSAAAAQALGDLASWTRARVDGSVAPPPQIRAVLGSSQGEQRQWVQGRLARVGASC